MTDLTKSIAAKSNILNADDLIGGPITIKITKVSIAAGEQPIAINYEGDNNKPFMPCKTVRRVLVGAWGADGNAYVGRSLILYRDPTVVYAGQEVGGIRVSHMSHIEKPITMALTATKKSKKPYIVKPIGHAAMTFEEALSDIATSPNLEGLKFKHQAAYKAFPDAESRKQIDEAKDKRKTELSA